MQIENLYRRNWDNHSLHGSFMSICLRENGLLYYLLEPRGKGFLLKVSPNLIHLLPATLTVCRASESRRELPPGFVYWFSRTEAYTQRWKCWVSLLLSPCCLLCFQDLQWDFGMYLPVPPKPGRAGTGKQSWAHYPSETLKTDYGPHRVLTGNVH